MSKTIKVTIGERYALLNIFDAFKGSLSETVAMMDDIKQVFISKEEWKKAGRVILGKDGQVKTDQDNLEQGDSLKWNEADEKTWKEITLQPEVVGYIQKTMKEKSDKAEFTLRDLALISLSKKLQ
jgi:hypothetical protein